jgi:hypothetical protein
MAIRSNGDARIVRTVMQTVMQTVVQTGMRTRSERLHAQQPLAKRSKTSALHASDPNTPQHNPFQPYIIYKEGPSISCLSQQLQAPSLHHTPPKLNVCMQRLAESDLQHPPGVSMLAIG